MKKFIFTVVLVVALSSITASAQTSNAEADAIINLLGVQKRQAMQQLVIVSKKDSSAFWKLYDDYQKVNSKQAKDRLVLYERTAMAYNDMNPTMADSLASRYFDNRMNQEKSLQDYYKKIKSATNAVTAFTFYQGEIYLIT